MTKAARNGLMADFGESGTAEIKRREKICDRLPSRRTRLTVLTEKRGRDGRKPIVPPSRRDAD